MSLIRALPGEEAGRASWRREAAGALSQKVKKSARQRREARTPLKSEGRQGCWRLGGQGEETGRRGGAEARPPAEGGPVWVDLRGLCPVQLVVGEPAPVAGLASS